jgi:hypothetical protein
VKNFTNLPTSRHENFKPSAFQLLTKVLFFFLVRGSILAPFCLSIPNTQSLENSSIKKEFIWKHLTPPEQTGIKKLEQELTNWLLRLASEARLEALFQTDS